MRNRTIPSRVLGALNHAAHTFRSFTVVDWLAMAEECTRRAEDATCVDCGRDMSLTLFSRPPTNDGREHRLKNDRWSCGRPL